MIDEKKRRAYLRLRLAEARTEKIAGFPVPVANRAVSEPFRGESGVSSLALKKGLKSKSPDEYSGGHCAEGHQTNRCEKGGVERTHKCINCGQTGHQAWARIVSLLKYHKYLMFYKDQRFARHSTFRYWALNTQMRHKANAGMSSSSGGSFGSAASASSPRLYVRYVMSGDLT